jgi:hypothetical protein
MSGLVEELAVLYSHLEDLIRQFIPGSKHECSADGFSSLVIIGALFLGIFLGILLTVLVTSIMRFIMSLKRSLSDERMTTGSEELVKLPPTVSSECSDD